MELPEKTRVCPRCGAPQMYEEDVMNALSRRDNKTYICSPCGTEEAFIDYGIKDQSLISQAMTREQDAAWLKK
jgi:hypothetical protein